MPDYDRRRFSAKRELELSHWGLEGLVEGKATTLYHGSTKLFRSFDLKLVREELVNNYYGSGIFLTPEKRIAVMYAEANRNIGFDVSIIADLKRRKPNAGAFLQSLYEHGPDAWEIYPQEQGLWDPEVGYQGTWFEEHLGVPDANTLADIAGYIIGSKEKPLGNSDPVNIFSQSSGAPDWIYDSLDEVGIDSKTYRPKVYTVSATASNVLVTTRKAQARKAKSKGFDCVIFHGADLVRGVPEVAIFNPRQVRVKKIEVV